MIVLSIMIAAMADPAPPAPPAQEKLICRRIDDNSTGWRLQKQRKVCRPAAEWRALDDGTYQVLNQAKSKGLFDPNSIPTGRSSTCTPAGAQAGRC